MPRAARPPGTNSADLAAALKGRPSSLSFATWAKRSDLPSRWRFAGMWRRRTARERQPTALVNPQRPRYTANGDYACIDSAAIFSAERTGGKKSLATDPWRPRPASRCARHTDGWCWTPACSIREPSWMRCSPWPSRYALTVDATSWPRRADLGDDTRLGARLEHHAPLRAGTERYGGLCAPLN